MVKDEGTEFVGSGAGVGLSTAEVVRVIPGTGPGFYTKVKLRKILVPFFTYFIITYILMFRSDLM